MLNNVPTQVSKAARQVTLRHPNSMDCTVFRKTLNRTESIVPEEFGGLPTIGGLGVLDNEDEADYDYEELGEARVVFTGQYQASDMNMNSADEGLNYQNPPVEALVECVLDPDDVNYFIPDKHDMITVYPGNGFALGYEIQGTTSNIGIPPYVRKYFLNPRADANVGI